MKNYLIVTLSFLISATFPAISNAGFMNNLEGTYQIGGRKCQFEAITKLTGKATIVSTTSGATVNIEVIIGALQTDIPLSFRNGNGDEKHTRMEGDILPLPVTRRVVWNTDEDVHNSTISEYEGVGIARKIGTYTLSEANNGAVTVRLESSDSNIIECKLVRN